MAIRHAVGLLGPLALLSGCASLSDLSSGGKDSGSDLGIEAASDAGTEASGDGSADACVADVAADPKNCGACAHDCLGGACAAGVCQPIPIAQSLPDSPFDTASLVVDEKAIYWTVSKPNGPVATCPLSGCVGGTPLVFATASSGSPSGIALDPSSVYWVEGLSTDGTVRTCPKSGCPTMLIELVSGTGYPNPYAIVVHGTDVYFTMQGQGTGQGASGSVGRCDLPGCPNFVRVAQGLSFPHGIATDGASVFWTDLLDNSIYSCPVAGCSAGPTLVAHGNGPHHLAVTATDIYWANYGSGSVVTCPIAGCSPSPSTLVSGLQGPLGIATDAQGVYFTDNRAGTVSMCPLTGCTSPTVLATNQASPGAIAVDASFVYWLNEGTGNGDAAVLKVAK